MSSWSKICINLLLLSNSIFSFCTPPVSSHSLLPFLYHTRQTPLLLFQPLCMLMFFSLSPCSAFFWKCQNALTWTGSLPSSSFFFFFCWRKASLSCRGAFSYEDHYESYWWPLYVSKTRELDPPLTHTQSLTEVYNVLLQDTQRDAERLSACYHL